jgi:hypothetical protein
MHTQGESIVKLRFMRLQAKELPEKGRREHWDKDPPLAPPEEAQFCSYFDIGPLVPEVWDNNFCSSKPPGLWHFVIVALES